MIKMDNIFTAFISPRLFYRPDAAPARPTAAERAPLRDTFIAGGHRANAGIYGADGKWANPLPAKHGVGASADDPAKHKCETCSSRKYQDQSDDPGVSFQSPTRVGSEAALSAVADHERSHQRRETRDAEQSGQKVVYSNIRLFMRRCPECNKTYVAGGQTQILKMSKNPEGVGQFFDKSA